MNEISCTPACNPPDWTGAKSFGIPTDRFIVPFVRINGQPQDLQPGSVIPNVFLEPHNLSWDPNSNRLCVGNRCIILRGVLNVYGVMRPRDDSPFGSAGCLVDLDKTNAAHILFQDILTEVTDCEGNSFGYYISPDKGPFEVADLIFDKKIEDCSGNVLGWAVRCFNQPDQPEFFPVDSVVGMRLQIIGSGIVGKPLTVTLIISNQGKGKLNDVGIKMNIGMLDLTTTQVQYFAGAIGPKNLPMQAPNFTIAEMPVGSMAIVTLTGEALAHGTLTITANEDEGNSQATASMQINF